MVCQEGSDVRGGGKGGVGMGEGSSRPAHCHQINAIPRLNVGAKTLFDRRQLTALTSTWRSSSR